LTYFGIPEMSNAVNSDFLKSVLYSLDDGVVVADTNGRFLLFSPSAEKMLGMGARDLDPKEWTDVYGCFYPDKTTSYHVSQLPLVRAMRGEEIIDEVMFIKNPQKQSGIWLNISGRPLKDDQGMIWGGLIIFRDITARKQAEERLGSTSLKFAALVCNQRNGILVENGKRRIQSVNQAFCDLFSIPMTPSELRGRDCSILSKQARSFFHDPDGFVSRIEQILRDGIIVTNERLHLSDGRIFERDYIPVASGEKGLGHVWKYRDISERELTSQKIKLMERLSRALEQTGDSVVITNTKGQIEYMNQAFETTTGYTRTELLGKTPAILKSGLHDLDFYRNLWGEIQAGRIYRGTIVNRKKTGELYYSEQSITPIKDDAGNITHYVSVLKDITELLNKKEREFEMRLAREVQQLYYDAKASLPGFDISGATNPTDEVGGDYFDFIEMPNGCLGVVIGDVSGHGISSALIMSATRAYLRSFSGNCDDVGQILTHLNRALEPDLDKGRFVTLLMICIDPKKRTLTYANAGHEYGYLLGKSGEVDFVFESGGPPLGVVPDQIFPTSQAIRLEKGQIAILLTDGLSDSLAADENNFLVVGAIDYVQAHRDKSSRRIAQGLCEIGKSQNQNRLDQDDVTSVIIKVME
jgi:PAS domain S-box-containing protein